MTHTKESLASLRTSITRRWPFVSKELMDEFTVHHGSSRFQQLQTEFDIQTLDTAPGRTQLLAGDLGITSPKRMNDLSALATAEQYGLGLVTGDRRLFTAAFRRGTLPRGLLRLRIFEHPRQQRNSFYDRLRSYIHQQDPNISPHIFTGSGEGR